MPPPPPPSATAGELAPVAAIVGGRHGECAGVHAPLPAATARAPATAAPRCAAPAAPLRDSPIGAAATPRLAIAELAAGSAAHPLPSAEPAAAARSLRSHRSQSATKDRSSAGASEAGATPVALVTARAAAATCAGCKAGAAAGMGAEGAVSSERKTASSEGGGGGGSGAPEWAAARAACRVVPPPWLLAPSPPPAPHAPWSGTPPGVTRVQEAAEGVWEGEAGRRAACSSTQAVHAGMPMSPSKDGAISNTSVSSCAVSAAAARRRSSSPTQLKGPRAIRPRYQSSIRQRRAEREAGDLLCLRSEATREQRRGTSCGGVGGGGRKG